MAKFITFNGITLIHPGGLTKVDATGMSQVGAGISGVVGIIGEAEYGQPYDPAGAALVGEEPKVYEFTNPESMAETFVAGQLADAVDFLFNPSNDIRIPGGVQRVIALKSNIDTQSSVAVEDISTFNVSCVLNSRIYGQHSNALAAEVSVNTADGNTLDLAVTDGNTGVTETFTQICGNQLLDVQYAPRDPVVSTLSTGPFAGVTTVDSAAADQLEILGMAGGTITADNQGQFVQIVTSSNADLPGQVRRILTVAGAVITVEGNFLDSSGTPIIAPSFVPIGTTFRIIRTAIGPFFVESFDTTGNNEIKTTSIVANQPSAWSVGDPTFFTPTPGAEALRYGDPENGPCYVYITAGAGEGQIRRIIDGATGISSINPGEIDIKCTEPWDVDPAPNSQFVFINAVPKHTLGVVEAPTATGGAGTGEGAYGVIDGSAGVSTALRLSLRPGYGETTTNITNTVDLGEAGLPANVFIQWNLDLSPALTVNALVTSINNGTAPGRVAGTGIEDGQWKAQVGPGRDGSLPTTRFDWGINDRRNNRMLALPDPDLHSDGVDCLCDFSSSSPAGNGTYDPIPKRFHRFVDNISLFVDTINEQSTLISALRATTDGPPGPVGGFFGDGVPAVGTYALTGGTAAETTASGLQACFDELIKHRHNTSVALWSTDTDAFTIDYVHSLLAVNAKRGAGAYRNEVDCIAAFQPQGTTSADLQTIKTKALTLNDRNVALTFQDIKRPGLNGLVNQYPPHMLACCVAGMQSGSTIGTPLTYKLVRANKILSKNTTIDVLDKTTSDDLLLSGVLFCEFVKNQGYRIVRNLSTYVATDNLAYTDRHVNYELNFMAYDLRTFIEERFIGVKATPATVASVKSSVISKLDYYKNGIEIIVDSQDLATGATLNAYRNLRVTISGDICTIRFEIFPAVGINYITFEIFAQLPTLSA